MMTSSARTPLQTAASTTPRASARNVQKLLVALRASGTKRPLFFVPGLGGHATSFAPLTQALGTAQPVYAFQARGLEDEQPPHTSLEAMAEAYAHALRDAQPQGPYLLGGWSLGGLVALNMARQLAAEGADVPLVVLLDTHLTLGEQLTIDLTTEVATGWLGAHLGFAPEDLRTLSPLDMWTRIAERARQSTALGSDQLERLAEVCKAQLSALAHYDPVPYHGPAVLWRAEKYWQSSEPRWTNVCPNLHRECLSGDHYSLLRPPQVEALARLLAVYLRDHCSR